MQDAIRNSALSDQLKEELTIFQAIKPYIGRCLGLNHELNNVLAGILGYTDFLKEESEGMTEDQQHYIDQIQKCAERIQNTLMGLSDEKIELGQNLDLRQIAEQFQKYDPDQPDEE
jgi:signal transduction histidine kinase